jgi:hypothetical protein
MKHSELDRILSELEFVSTSDKEFLMAHLLLLIPQLEALDNAISDSLDLGLKDQTSEIRKIIPDLIHRIANLVGK